MRVCSSTMRLTMHIIALFSIATGPCCRAAPMAFQREALAAVGLQKGVGGERGFGGQRAARAVKEDKGLLP